MNRRTVLALIGAAAASPLVSRPVRAEDSLDQLYQQAKKDGSVVMYTSVPTFLLDRWKQVFEQRYPGVPVSYFRSGTGKVLARIETERRAGKVGGDIVWLADPTTFDGLVKSNALAPYQPPEWSAITLAKEPHGLYIAGRILVGVLLVNKQQLPDSPKSFADLVKPQYKGRIAIASPLISGSTNMINGALLKDPRFGWAYFEGLKRNDVLVLPDVPDVARSVASGERAAGISLTLYKYQPEFEKSPMEIVFPAEGSVPVASPLGLLSGAPHPAAAKLFYRFLLSQPAQAVLAESGLYPARNDTPPPKGLPPLTELKTMEPDSSWILAHQEENNERWRQIFGG
jgi:iron(III) transport system substrate-binding protein